MYRETKTRMTPYFSLETMQVSRLSLIFKVWKEKAVLTKISFKTKTKTKTFFTDIHNLKEFQYTQTTKYVFKKMSFRHKVTPDGNLDPRNGMNSKEIEAYGGNK